MTYAHEIEAAEQALEQAKRSYLQRWGWTQTCETPGSYWMWRRDFADYDATFDAWHAAHPDRPRRVSSGVMTLPTDLAVSMTIGVLDEQLELTGEEA